MRIRLRHLFIQVLTVEPYSGTKGFSKEELRTQESELRSQELQELQECERLECWSAGVLECWSAGVLEYWSTGVLEFSSFLSSRVLPPELISPPSVRRRQ